MNDREITLPIPLRYCWVILAITFYFLACLGLENHFQAANGKDVKIVMEIATVYYTFLHSPLNFCFLCSETFFLYIFRLERKGITGFYLLIILSYNTDPYLLS